MTNRPEMMDSVNELILADRGVEIEDISEQLGVFLGTAHKIVYDDLAFSKVSCLWVCTRTMQDFILLQEQEHSPNPPGSPFLLPLV